jgi:hypothetical protein
MSIANCIAERPSLPGIKRGETEEEHEGMLQDALNEGYGLAGYNGNHIREFADILFPAGFYVCEADKIESAPNDTYILKVIRKTPKDRSGG